jgi:hypothetical protein
MLHLVRAVGRPVETALVNAGGTRLGRGAEVGKSRRTRKILRRVKKTLRRLPKTILRRMPERLRRYVAAHTKNPTTIVRLHPERDDYGVYGGGHGLDGKYKTPLLFRGTLAECLKWQRP